MNARHALTRLGLPLRRMLRRSLVAQLILVEGVAILFAMFAGMLLGMAGLGVQGQSLMQPDSTSRWMPALLSGAALLLICAGLWAWVRHATRKLLEPLTNLARVTSEHAAGQPINDQLLCIHSRNEIGIISRAFKRLLNTDERARSSLEARVASRTRDLAKAQSRLACILESMLDLVYSISLDQKQVLYVSPACYAILGVNEKDIYDKPRLLVELCHPEDFSHVRAARQHVLNGGTGEVQYRIIRPDGEIRWVLDRFYLVFDAEGNGSHIDGLVSDITERVRADHAREEAEALLRLKDRALAASMNGVVISDMRQADQPIIYVNPAFERISGYSATEIIGSNCRFLQGEETDQSGVNDIRDAIREGRETTVQIRNYRKDGQMFWNELSVAPVRDPVSNEITHYIGIQNDITVKRESEQRLFEWFVRFETIFTLSPDGFVSFGQDGTITYVNPAFERMLGLNSGDLLGINLDQLDGILKERADSKTHYFGVRDAMNPGAVPQSNFIVLETPVHRTVQWSARECSAQAASLVMYFRDVTREAEVDRMKSDFLSTAAHELRTPMASIMGFSELLLARKFNEERTRDMLDTINRQSVRLTHLINELLDLARIESRAGKDFQIQPIALNTLINETLGALMMRGDNRTVTALLPPELPEVCVDAEKLQQALTNILSNAYKYSPAGGEIRLDIVRRESDGHPQIGIRVEDHGIGMTPEQLSHLYERFYRADSSCNIPGTGLGMSLVKEIIELHHGQVEVCSQYGQGTIVTLWLPLPEEQFTLFAPDTVDDATSHPTDSQENRTSC